MSIKQDNFKAYLVIFMSFSEDLNSLVCVTTELKEKKIISYQTA